MWDSINYVLGLFGNDIVLICTCDFLIVTFKYSKSVAVDWHKTGKLAWPDENYARENLQLHSIGLLKLNDDGTNVLDRFGKSIANYEQKHIFAAAKVWTSFIESFRRGNYEDRKSGFCCFTIAYLFLTYKQVLLISTTPISKSIPA